MKNSRMRIGVITVLLFTSFSCKKNVEDMKSTHPVLTDTALASKSLTLAKVTYPGVFTLGVNGHSLNSPAYTNTTALSQLKLIKSLGMGYYRFDLVAENNGYVQGTTLFNALVEAAATEKITLIPTISATTLDLYNLAGAYQAGKNLGYNFAKVNGKYFTYYGMGNELDNIAILSGRSGQSTSDYDPKKVQVIATYLKGMDAGIKLADPTAQTMVDESFLHYAFLQILQKDGVNFNIVACHWYSEMEAVAAKSPYNIPDITVKLSSLFAKPIWFTEVNQRYKTSNLESLQNTFLTNFTVKCKHNPQVKALLVYELFDEKFRTPIQEATYGIMKWTKPYTVWNYKLYAKNLLEH